MCSRECEWIRIRDEWEVEVGGRSADIMREAVKREIKGFEAKWTDNRSRIIVYWVGIDPGVSYCSKKINSKILHRGFSKLRWIKILLLLTIAVCLRRNTTASDPKLSENLKSSVCWLRCVCAQRFRQEREITNKTQFISFSYSQIDGGASERIFYVITC